MRRMAALMMALLMATLVATSIAGGQAAPPVAPAPKVSFLHFRMLFSPFFMLDLGRKGPSIGDQIISHDHVLNNTGAIVGHDAAVCTVSDPKRPEANCVVSFRLPGGIVTAQFLNTPPPEKLAAITGGTERFRGVSGEVRIVESRTSRAGVATFTLLSRPGQ